MSRSVRFPVSAFAAVNWLAVGCFYLIACGLSYALRNLPNPTAGILPLHTIFTYGLGPITAALIARRLFPAIPTTITLLGNKPRRTLLFALLPLVVSLVIGITNKRGIDPHLYGGLVVVSGVLWGLMEETGWRGFLHDALQPLPKPWRIGITALLWGGWHTTFLTDTPGLVGPNGNIGLAIGALMLGSWGLGNAVERTRSVLVVACLHEVFNLTGPSVGLGIVLVAWTWMLWTWTRSFPLPVRLKNALAGLIGCFLAMGAGQEATAQPAPIPKQELDLTADKPDFSLFDKAFYGNQLFLLGESHGFKKAQAVDLALLKHLNQRVGVRFYIAEVDPAKAWYLNQYLQTGQDSTLRLVFRSWIAETAQWANQDFFRKVQAIRAYNQTLPAKKRIRFVGIDAMQDKALVVQQLRELTLGPPAGSGPFAADQPRLDSIAALLMASPKKPDSLAAQVALHWLAKLRNQPADYKSVALATKQELTATLTGLSYRKTIKRREATLFANFRDAIARLGLQTEKLYGFFGAFHISQAPMVDGNKAFAAQIQASDLPMRGKTVSLLCRYVDSFMMTPTAYLPPFWQDKGNVYTRLDKFNDNGPMMTIDGIKDFMAQSQPNTVTLFKLLGTAAGMAPITATYSPFMPADQRLTFDPKRPTTDYFQYIVLVRNSDMTEPF